MAMVMTPLLIKVKMTRENYINLIKEASTKFSKYYLKQNYLYDGTYFTLDTCEMDDYEIFRETDMIIKYADLTQQEVGLIYNRGCSYSVSKLIFLPKGTYDFGDEITNAGRENNKKVYLQAKETFLSQFPVAENINAEIFSEIFSPQVEKYECLGISRYDLQTILEQEGYKVKRISCSYGCVYVMLSGTTETAENVLAKLYNADRVRLYCEDGEQQFPQEIIIILIKGNNKE